MKTSGFGLLAAKAAASTVHPSTEIRNRAEMKSRGMTGRVQGTSKKRNEQQRTRIEDRGSGGRNRELVADRLIAASPCGSGRGCDLSRGALKLSRARARAREEISSVYQYTR
jgi:hypothetical protein